MTPPSLWSRVYDWQNLLQAHYAARRGKRYRPAVLKFSAAVEERLIELHNHLIWKTWEPSPFRVFKVLDPKPRIIQAPAYSDRVVHHALVQAIEPIFERRFIHDSYACRREKGVHAAILRLQSQLRRAQRHWERVYVLQADISKFFASIPHDRLITTIRRSVFDADVVWLCEKIIRYGGENGIGIPVGALTSQLFANAYLDRLDHWVKDDLGEKFYVRYMDDFVVLGPNPGDLHQLRHRIEAWLSRELGLKINPKTCVFPAKHGVDFCGYRTWSTHILPRKRNVRRARRHLAALSGRFARSTVDASAVTARLASLRGYLKHCDAHRLSCSIADSLTLRRKS